jgi:hypothetical protein
MLEAIGDLTGKRMIDRLHEGRKPAPNRFPRWEYASLTPEEQAEIHEHIRRLAISRRT